MGGTQVVEHTVGEEAFDDLVHGRTDHFGLAETPLRVLEFIGKRFRRHVFVEGRVAPLPMQPTVDGDQFVITEDPDRGVGGPEPERLADQSERYGIEILLEGDMGVAVDLDLGPHGKLDRDVGEGTKQRLLRLCKHLQREPAG